MRSRRPGRRQGFTLIELLVVIVILVVLITLAAMFLPNLDRNKGVPNAVTQIEGWIRLQKNQALRDGAPRGLRLIPDANNPSRCVQLQYIEQPEPLAPRGPGIQAVVSTENPNSAQGLPPPYPNPMPTTVTLTRPDPNTGNPVPTNWDEPTSPQINVGDFFELTGGPSAVCMIVGVTGSAQAPRSQLVLDRSIDGTDVAPLGLADGFRVIRGPRPLAGEPALELNKDIYIDLANCYPVPPGVPPDPANGYTFNQAWSPTGGLDILFNSSGVVANAATGQLILAVRHVDRPTDILFVVVYTRTGKVTAVPAFDSGGDPYVFARDGRNPGI